MKALAYLLTIAATMAVSTGFFAALTGSYHMGALLIGGAGFLTLTAILAYSHREMSETY